MAHPRVALALTLIMTACTGQPDPADHPDGSLLLRDVTLIDGTGAPPREHVSVLVRSGVIAAIGDALEVQGARVVEGRGRFLIPGLWDAHAHVTYGDETTLGVLVANGVTSVRDMGGELDVLEPWRARIEKGDLVGPRIFRAGPTVDGPKPPGIPHRLTITNPEEARAAVTRLRELGVDLIKIHNAVPRDAFFALAAEARKRGIPFAGHVPMTVEPAEAAEAGQHSVEHIATLVEGTYAARFSSEEAALAAMPRWVEDEVPALARTFLENGTWFVPTIVAYELRARRGELADHPDPRVRYVPSILRKAWDRDAPVSDRDRNPEVIARRRRFVELGREMTRRMHEAGVGIAAGSDLAGRDVLPGFAVHDEIGHLVASGLTPMEALRAGTSEAARLLGASGTVGTIAPGKTADLMLLDGDSLADVKNVARISAVVLRGKLLERADLDRLLEAAATPRPAGGARSPGPAPRRTGA